MQTSSAEEGIVGGKHELFQQSAKIEGSFYDVDNPQWICELSGYYAA